jgi:dTDP-D-glucose 4,6-dehydratase
MSNFIRYLLYRTKEYDVVSVDALFDPDDFKRVYKHKKHNFYLGDLRDKRFIDTLVKIEKPKYIINSISYNLIDDRGPNWVDAFKIFDNLLMQGRPMIQIIPSKDLDFLGTWEMFRSNDGGTFAEENVLLEIPSCFGMRQHCRDTENIAYIIKNIMEDKTALVSDHIVPWVYAEDVASLIWFLIENDLNGYYRIPELGISSEIGMAKIISNVLNKDLNIEVKKDASSGLEFKSDKIEGWIPDSPSLKVALEKTVGWYNVNKWALRP